MSGDLRGARVGEDLVLLDLEVGAYELVAGFFAGAEEPSGWMARWVTLGLPAGQALEDWLGAGAPTPAVPLPREGLEGRAKPTLADRRDFFRTWSGLATGYVGRPFAQLLTPPSLTAAPTGEAAELERRCRSFATLLPWAPFQGVCLYRAFFLRAFLARSGHAPQWVFGVRTWPFQAHCWLQEGGLVLNDDPERVRRFIPLLVA